MRTRSVAWSELKLGILGVIAIALVTVLVLAVGGQGGFFWQRYPLKAQFHDVHGLKTGAVVRLNGMEVGKVTGIYFVGAEVEVAMTVARRVRHLITTDSRASIGSLSMLGEPVVDLSAAATGTVLDDGAYVAADHTGGISALATTASRGVAEAGRIVEDLRSGRGSLGRFMTDDALYRDLDALVATAGRVSQRLEKGHGSLGSLLNDRDAYDVLNATLHDLRAVAARINAGSGTLGQLVTNDSLSVSLGAVARNLEEVSGQLARGEGTAGRLVSDTLLYSRVGALVERLDHLAGNLEEGRGSAGRLLQDDVLYENMALAAAELRALIADIRSDPRRYLHVRVGLF